MANLVSTFLDLPRCPHCNVDRPSLAYANQLETNNYLGSHQRYWRIYRCNRCGGLITASAGAWNTEIKEMYPSPINVNDVIPSRAKEYLNQAINSLSSPVGAVMLAASAVDAMLKAKGLKEGSLYSRIDAAAEGHIITSDMASWAHEVRLDANEQRHADEQVELPNEADAKRCVDFVLALAEIMFVLPARIQSGIAEAKS